MTTSTLNEAVQTYRARRLALLEVMESERATAHPGELDG